MLRLFALAALAATTAAIQSTHRTAPLQIRGGADDARATHACAAALAAAKGKAVAVQSFLQRGVKVDAVDSLHRSTPLHWAAGAGKVNTMEMLIARGATLDARSESDATPLHQAVLRDRPEAVKLLLNSNANVNLKNKSGYTPLDYATANKRTEITQLLKSAGALSGKAL